MEQELSELMQTPFSFDEFLKALGHGGNSSPGESGISYRLLQVAPEVVQREIFVLLQDFWDQDCTPEQWKRVVLILIQKNAEKPAMLGNFRPIGLLEVLRKVWTKMITSRILPLLKKHSVLQPNQFAFLPGKGTASKLIQLINVLEEASENGLEIDLTTADVKCAFDSPEQTAQWASWRRVRCA
jgi:hypothetical protein